MEAVHPSYYTAPSILLKQGGIDSYTKLCLECDGPNNSTTIIDSSPTPKTITAEGDAKLSTSTKKFGSASCYFDGTGDYLTIDDSADWYMAGDPFTIDFWFNMPTVPQMAGFFRQWADGDNYVKMNMSYGGIPLTVVIGFTIKASGTETVYVYRGVTSELKAGTWHHVAIIRGWGGNANDWVVTFDGIAGAIKTDADEWPDMAAAFDIGRDNTSYYFTGYKDEFRISKGIARWTANFTPPTGEYKRLSK